MAEKFKKKFGGARNPSNRIGRVVIDDVDEPSDKSNLQIQVHLDHASQLARVVEELSKAQSCRKVELSIHLAGDQLISGKQSEPTIRVCRVRQMADKTLQCSACGRKIPSTPKGEIDKDQLALEMSLRAWTCLR